MSDAFVYEDVIMAKRRKFYLYQRKKKRGDYWYVCFIDPQTGRQGNAKSIDVLKERLGLGDNEATVNRDDAAIIANKALEAGIVFSSGAEELFSSYCLRFWDFDNSEYIRLRNQVSPDSIGREYTMNMLCNLKKHVLPEIPTSLKLSAVSTRHLDNVVSKAFDKGLANGTIQMIVLLFSIPLKESLRQRYIVVNPCDNLMKIPRNEKGRGVFTDDEISSILKYVSSGVVDVPIANAVTLAVLTGMRNGEIRALRCDDIEQNYRNGYDRVTISRSLAPYTGVKSTKGKYDRVVFIPHDFGDKLIKDSINGIIISSDGEYMSSLTLRLSFYSVLHDLGISEEVRSERRLTFHSLRHYFSTYTCQENINQEDRMAVLGHKSEKVNDRYTHVSDTRLERVAEVMEKLYRSE